MKFIESRLSCINLHISGATQISPLKSSLLFPDTLPFISHKYPISFSDWSSSQIRPDLLLTLYTCRLCPWRVSAWSIWFSERHHPIAMRLGQFTSSKYKPSRHWLGRRYHPAYILKTLHKMCLFSRIKYPYCPRRLSYRSSNWAPNYNLLTH